MSHQLAAKILLRYNLKEDSRQPTPGNVGMVYSAGRPDPSYVSETETMKRVIIIAGPNGAGKTTFAKEYLPDEGGCPTFINADLLAAGLSPFDPAAAAIPAGRLMLLEMRRYFERGESFAFESTLSGRSYALHIAQWQSAGYCVRLIFLKLPSIRLALARIKARVAHGGHRVSRATVRRRFKAGWRNFEELYSPLVNCWELYDNSGDRPVRLAEGKNP